MSGWELTLKQQPDFDLDAAAISSVATDAGDISKISLPSARPDLTAEIGELFHVKRRDDELVHISGDLTRFHRLGHAWSGGSLVVEGSVGVQFAAQMRAGTITLRGDADDGVATQMRGGDLFIQGNIGDFAAGPLPGRRSGMRGGRLRLIGNAGHHTGHRLRRGWIMIRGSVGDCLASDMVAGTIAVSANLGDNVGAGMKRGTLVLSPAASLSSLRFTPPRPVSLGITQLIADELQSHLPDVAAMLRNRLHRSLGDLTAGGMGEILLAH